MTRSLIPNILHMSNTFGQKETSSNRLGEGLTKPDDYDSLNIDYCNRPEVFMEKLLFDSELRLMEIVWEREPVCAKELSLLAGERFGWNKNTTYTVLKKLVGKGVLQRQEPNFVCSSLLKREEVQRRETKSLIDKLFQGSRKAFFAAFLQEENISQEELDELREMIEKR